MKAGGLLAAVIGAFYVGKAVQEFKHQWRDADDIELENLRLEQEQLAWKIRKLEVKRMEAK